MVSESHDIVIVGAGQAGGWVAKTLRSEGFDGSICLIGEEVYPPHERPPLSKGVMTGSVEPSETHLFDDAALDELHLDFRAATRAAKIDLTERTVGCEDGSVIGYDKLVLTTGARVRRLNVDGADHDCVRYLRTIDDSLAIRDAVEARRKVLVIGGGWIGLEVAASARKLGAEVVLVEVAERLCIRTLPPEIAAFVQRMHEENGVSIRLGRNIQSFEDASDGSVAAVLDDASRLETGVVVVGIGIVPNTQLAEDAGLAVDNGIVVDASGRTSDPFVFACGDVASYHHPHVGRSVRLESWANAQNHAIETAKAVLGKDSNYCEVPWFWSDQFDLNLQILGLPEAWSQPVVRGDLSKSPFTAFYLEGNHIQAMIAANNPRDVMVGRRLIERRVPVEAEDLGNPDIALKQLLRR